MMRWLMARTKTTKEGHIPNLFNPSFDAMIHLFLHVPQMLLQTSRVLRHVIHVTTYDSFVATFVSHVAIDNLSVATFVVHVVTHDSSVTTYVSHNVTLFISTCLSSFYFA
ncbi:hypothetical protein EJD97_020594 [Solanum chilense]|uniref:Uncharacterized protein n=1 Tax=Solanum chilense TaxID=4083 RepID=A0A6N2CCV2_SOLCI|nr:hypothetical protein EJD97_020594 [Solanum chilense]